MIRERDLTQPGSPKWYTGDPSLLRCTSSTASAVWKEEDTEVESLRFIPRANEMAADFLH